MFFDGPVGTGSGGGSRGQQQQRLGERGGRRRRQGIGGIGIGNHRSINLGGKSKTISRHGLLQESNQLRQERWKKQRQIQMTILIQKWIRGILHRIHLRKQLLHDIFVLQQQEQEQQKEQEMTQPQPMTTSTTTTTKTIHLETLTRQVNVLFRLLLRLKYQQQKQQQEERDDMITNLLQLYADQLLLSISNSSSSNTQENHPVVVVMYSKYIWQQTLIRMKQQMLDPHSLLTTTTKIKKKTNKKNNNTLNLSSAWCILRYCLPPPTTTTTIPTTTTTTVSTSTSSSWTPTWKYLGTDGILLLCETCLRFVIPNENHLDNDDNDNNNNKNNKEWLRQYIEAILPQPEAHAILGVLQWMGPQEDQHKQQYQHTHKQQQPSSVSTNTQSPQQLQASTTTRHSSSSTTTTTLVALIQALLEMDDASKTSKSMSSSSSSSSSINWSQMAIQLIMNLQGKNDTTTTTTSTTTTNVIKDSFFVESLLRLLDLAMSLSKNNYDDNNNNNIHNQQPDAAHTTVAATTTNTTLVSPTLLIRLVWKIWQLVPSFIAATTLVTLSPMSSSSSSQQEEEKHGTITTSNMALEQLLLFLPKQEQQQESKKNSNNNNKKNSKSSSSWMVQQPMDVDDDDDDDTLMDDDEEEDDNNNNNNDEDTIRPRSGTTMTSRPTRSTIATTAATTTTNTTTAAASRTRTVYTKQELLTAPKLERLFAMTRDEWIQDQLQQLIGLVQQQQQEQRRQEQQELNVVATIVDKKESTTKNTNRLANLMIRLATQLANPYLWLEWGLVILSSTTTTATTTTNTRTKNDDMVDENNDKDNHDDDMMMMKEAQYAYMAALAVLLQGNRTGLYNRTSANSPFLTQLAFAPSLSYTWIQLLWQHIGRCSSSNDNNNNSHHHHRRTMDDGTIMTSSMSIMMKSKYNPQDKKNNNDHNNNMMTRIHLHCAWSIFCDIFSQQLIAVRDTQFLQRHTTVTNTSILNAATTYNDNNNKDDDNNNNNNKILAKHVIVQLKQYLYELYWSQPVLVHETKSLLVPLSSSSSFSSLDGNNFNNNNTLDLSAARIRLFLTGTKLFNSLYERWCRLLRRHDDDYGISSSFCDESAWLFPNHGTLSFLGSAAGTMAGTTATGGDGIVRRPDGSIIHYSGELDDMDDDDDDDMDDDDDNAMDVDDEDRDGNPAPTRRQRRNHHVAAAAAASAAMVDVSSRTTTTTTTRNAQQEEQEYAETEALANVFHDPKMARILTSIPQCLSFDRRVKLFHTLLQVDKVQTQDESSDIRATVLAMMRGHDDNDNDDNNNNNEQSHGRVHVEIRRDALYLDSMSQLNQLGPKLKKKVKVSFINQHGTQEAGIDGGGVFKEFLDDLIKEAFTPPPPTTTPSSTQSPSSTADAASLTASSTTTTAASMQQQQEQQQRLQLFAVTPNLETLMVNPIYGNNQKYLSHYEFLGRAVGKAVYESILVEPQFCLPFLNTILGKSNTLEDLKNYDPIYYHSLIQLLNMNSNDLIQTGLTFEINIPGQQQQVGKPTTTTMELLNNGATKMVTKQNVIQYVHLVSHCLLNVQNKPAIRAFMKGFHDLIPSAWIRLFSSAHELQKLISGNEEDDEEYDEYDEYENNVNHNNGDSNNRRRRRRRRGFNVPALQASMSYAAGYHPSQPVVMMVRVLVWFGLFVLFCGFVVVCP